MEQARGNDVASFVPVDPRHRIWPGKTRKEHTIDFEASIEKQIKKAIRQEEYRRKEEASRQEIEAESEQVRLEVARAQEVRGDVQAAHRGGSPRAISRLRRIKRCSKVIQTIFVYPTL